MAVKSITRKGAETAQPLGPAKESPLIQQWLARDAEVISPSYTRSYPLVVDHGRGAELWDIEGRRYIDFNAGIAVVSTGHAHPEVVRAIQGQAARFIHMSGTDFYYPMEIELAEKLDQLAPGAERHQTFLSNSGAEAIEAAFKLARHHSGRPRMLAFLGGFHGRSMGALSLTASKPIQREGFAPLVPGVTHAPFAYCYRCPLRLEYPACDIACVRYIEQELFQHSVPPREVAAIVVEPILGEGGYVVPPPEFHIRLQELAGKYGILYVADEVQTGIGRTGKMFASEHWGVEPDILCLAKGIASGMPLGATTARRSVMTWGPGAHGNTFGGNPISCAAALVTLRLVEQQYMANAARLGEVALERLRALQRRVPQMGDVRGLGLMIGVEMVRNPATREPAPALRDQIVQEAFARGLLILGAGASTLRFSPPLAISRTLLDEGLDILEESIMAALTV